MLTQACLMCIYFLGLTINKLCFTVTPCTGDWLDYITPCLITREWDATQKSPPISEISSCALKKKAGLDGTCLYNAAIGLPSWLPAIQLELLYEICC